MVAYEKIKMFAICSDSGYFKTAPVKLVANRMVLVKVKRFFIWRVVSESPAKLVANRMVFVKANKIFHMGGH